MTVYTQARRNAAFLSTEANGHLSREVVTLKAGTAYPAGAVLAAETTAGASTAPTGFYVLLNAELVAEGAAAVVLIRAEDATDGAVDSAVIARHAEIKAGLIEAAPGVTPAQIRAALALNTIVVRDSF